MDDLIDTADIAAILKCSREHVTDRLTKQPSFPKPRVNLSRKMRRWDRQEVLDWLAVTRKVAA